MGGNPNVIYVLGTMICFDDCVEVFRMTLEITDKTLLNPWVPYLCITASSSVRSSLRFMGTGRICVNPGLSFFGCQADFGLGIHSDVKTVSGEDVVEFHNDGK